MSPTATRASIPAGWPGASSGLRSNSPRGASPSFGCPSAGPGDSPSGPPRNVNDRSQAWSTRCSSWASTARPLSTKEVTVKAASTMASSTTTPSMVRNARLARLRPAPGPAVRGEATVRVGRPASAPGVGAWRGRGVTVIQAGRIT
ncbi:hypothetical protein ACFFX0_16150 [Citricoccus parietis]|uniref:Uncharacterized protein n=1 Tax=Citricoccus parietis TaxID=592307 RepID=A0ABV5G134_9MICC